MIAVVDDPRFPATRALTRFWAMVHELTIETHDAPGNKDLPAAVHSLELEHWLWMRRVWSGWKDDRFIAKRIEDMTMQEFIRWSRQGAAARKRWIAWVTGRNAGGGR